MSLGLIGISAGYDGASVLHDVTFEVADGGCVCLIGANGAGKTTTMRAISGLLRPSAGRIVLDGQDIAGLSPDRILARGLAMVPEGRRVFAPMTVQENLEMGAFLRRDPPGVLRDLDWTFALFPRLLDRRRQLAGTLSGGEQQMLAIGRALMGRPRMLLLDEPSMGLAPLVVRDIFAVIAQLNREGLTILLAEQNARLALRTAAHGAVLADGRVTITAPSPTLLASTMVQEAYLGV